MRFLQKIEGEVVGCANGGRAIRLAEIGRAFGEEIERTFGIVHLKSRNFFRQTYNEILAAKEGLTHFLNRSLITIEGSHRSLLRDRTCTRSVLTLELVHRLCEGERSSHKTDAPTRHGISLRHPIDDGGALLHIGQSRDGSMLAHIVDMFVNLIGNDKHLRMLAKHFGKTFQFFKTVHRTSGVGRTAKDDCLRARRDGSCQLLGSNLEILLDGGFHKYGFSVCQTHHVGIAHPIRRRDDDFIARIHHREQHVAHRLFGTIAHHNLRGLVVQSIFTFQFSANGLTKIKITRHRTIARPVVGNGLLPSSLDVVGRVEIGFTHREVDDVDALSFEFGTLLRHCQCGRGSKTIETIGKLHKVREKLRK